MTKNDSGRSRAVRTRIERLLAREDADPADALSEASPQALVGPLLSLLLHREPRIRQGALHAFGLAVAEMANAEMESARNVMRRLMWSLNDESGGIGWAAPQAMAEVMVRHEAIALEYHKVFISYLDPRGNYLEYSMLQRNLLMAFIRAASARPGLFTAAHGLIPAYLDADDPQVRAIAAWACGALHITEADESLRALLNDTAAVDVRIGTLECATVGQAVQAALDLQPPSRAHEGSSGRP